MTAALHSCFSSQSTNPVDIAENTNTWVKQRNLCKVDLAIKAIAIGALVLLSAAASLTGLLVSVHPLGIVGGIPLGSLSIGLAGGVLNLCIQKGIEKRQVLGIGKSLFDLRLYFQPKTALKVCEDLKNDNFRHKITQYQPSTLSRYGFISAEAASKMEELTKMMEFLDKSDTDWSWNHLREIKLFRDNPEDPGAIKAKERKEIVMLKEEIIESRWKEIQDQYILGSLPEIPQT
jgi:hypothetical protein